MLLVLLQQQICPLQIAYCFWRGHTKGKVNTILQIFTEGLANVTYPTKDLPTMGASHCKWCIDTAQDMYVKCVCEGAHARPCREDAMFKQHIRSAQCNVNTAHMLHHTPHPPKVRPIMDITKTCVRKGTARGRTCSLGFSWQSTEPSAVTSRAPPVCRSPAMAAAD